MSRSKSESYVCNNCGENYPKWAGRCNTCGEWNSLVVFHESSRSASKTTAGTALMGTPVFSNAKKPNHQERFNVRIDQVNSVLGGGLVSGSLTLIAGEPGIGKSTLLLQIATGLSHDHKVLYASGEESLEQIQLRAKRLGVKSSLQVISTNSADDVAATIASQTYDVVIIDSIQTIAVEGVATSAGSASQVTNSTQVVMQATKGVKTSCIIVGHVTKEGSIAGPKLLEHMVDVVLSLEGDRHGGLKLLRTSKNRYGSTNEVGIFDMTDKGLVPVDNPSKLLLAERQASDGSVVLSTIEGSRALLVEVQALVSKTSFGYPKRTASGIDINRLNLLVAVLNQRTKLDLSSSDIYVNIVGGIKITETASDLAVCMAIASASKAMMLKEDAVVFGEVGLSGEIRHVPMLEKRILEAKKLGFGHVIGPATAKAKNDFMIPVNNLRDVLNKFLESKR